MMEDRICQIECWIGHTKLVFALGVMLKINLENSRARHNPFLRRHFAVSHHRRAVLVRELLLNSSASQCGDNARTVSAAQAAGQPFNSFVAAIAGQITGRIGAVVQPLGTGGYVHRNLVDEFAAKLWFPSGSLSLWNPFSVENAIAQS